MSSNKSKQLAVVANSGNFTVTTLDEAKESRRVKTCRQASDNGKAGNTTAMISTTITVLFIA